MALIRAADLIAKKWASVTPQRTADYEAGVRSPRADWANATTAAVAAYETGVQASIVAKSFGKGVAKAGTPGWLKGVVEKGLARWGPGVQIGESDYLKGFAPYRQAIASVNLPPRFARRDPRNLLRVAAIVDAMNAAKKAQGGS